MDRTLRFGAIATAALCFWLPAAGCLLGGGGDDDDDDGGTLGVGDSCHATEECRGSLVCDTSGTCQPAGESLEGDFCVLTGDCAEGLFCGPGRACEAAGEGADGADCDSTADCQAGLVCVVEGFGSRCRAAAEGDLDDVCQSEPDCLAGLACELTPSGEWVCADPAPGPGTGLPPMVPFWQGEECPPDRAAPTSYFHVPRGDDSDRDFYSLPYPNDIRRTATGIDLSGHASPGTLVPVDVIGRYLRASEEDLDGFAVNTTAYFRFSSRYSGDSLDGALHLVNITADSPDYGRNHSIAWMNTYGRVSNYICDNWLGIRRMAGEPLRPGETYAFTIGTAIVDRDGGAFDRAADFEAMLSDEEPTETALAAAWEAYQPLRDWLVDSEEEPAAILNAAVFTTQDPEGVISRLREAVRATDRPTLSDLTLCGDGVVSPCDDGTEARACGAADPAFHEIHGRIALPIFQQGTPPYEEPEDGGGIEVDGGNLPLLARTEEVCFAMTIPAGAAMPEGGYPLLIYGHGTGGSFRNAVRFGLAEEMADGRVGDADVTAATLSIDFPQHGERRGGSTRDSEFLFFNFTNPRAARDNVAQGAADLHALVYFAEAFDLAASDSPTGDAIAFDGTHVALFGHSQGATHGSLMIPFERGLVAVVLSGNGGDLTQSLLNKTEPIDIAGVLPFALLDANSEGGLTAGSFHPALALFQAYFERVDPVNFARRLHRDPLEGDPGRHVFMTYGLGDSFSPEPTQEAYARAAHFTVVLPYETEEWSLPGAEAPLADNVTVGDAPWTVGLRQYVPEGDDDGHYVSTQTDLGRADVLRFLRLALSGQVPQIGE